MIRFASLLTLGAWIGSVFSPFLMAIDFYTPSGVYYVDALQGHDGTGSGSPADPWKTITHAVTQCNGGDTIRILPGTYNPALGEIFPIQMKPGLSLVGSGPEATLLSAPGATSVIYIGSKTVDFLSDTRISDLTVQDAVHGIEVYTSQGRVINATITNVVARANTQGIYMSIGGVYENGAVIGVTISDTQVIQNASDGIYLFSFGYFSPSTLMPTIQNSRIESNGGHGLFVWGEATSANGTSASPRVKQTLIANNGGDGVHNLGTYQGWARPDLERSMILDNAGYGFFYDMDINGGNVDAHITNSVIAGNDAGGVYIGRRSYYSYFNASSVKITNSNVIHNGGVGIYWFNNLVETVAPTVLNSIVWNPASDDLYTNDGAWTASQISYSDIEDGDLNGVEGNISADPVFLDRYHVNVCSPVRDAGIGAGAPSIDLDGVERPQGPFIDIGATEITGGPCGLHIEKSVSATQARVGDTLVYTISLRNIYTATLGSVVMTDTLPAGSAYLPGTLWASKGDPGFSGDTLSWSGDLSAGEVLALGFQTEAILGDILLVNRAYGDAGVLGRVISIPCSTQVSYYHLFLPALSNWPCNLVFVDNFNDPETGWPVGSIAAWDFGYHNGEYRMFAQAGEETLFVTRGDQIDRFTLEADVRQSSTANGSLGLLFGLNSDWSDLYTFEIYPAQQMYAIFRYYNNSWSILAQGQSSSIQSGTGVNHLKVTWKSQSGSSDRYEFLVNATSLRTLNLWAAPAAPRRVGFTATSDYYGFDARFDAYRLLRTSCSESPPSPLGRPDLRLYLDTRRLLSFLRPPE